MENFKQISQEKLKEYEKEIDIIKKAKGGDDDALSKLMTKYEKIVKIKSRTYFLVGADREDLFQEGMIGLYKAIRDFNFEKAITFRNFAEMCVVRQMITAIKTATRQKHKPLNSYVSLNKTFYDENGEKTLYNILPSEDITANPEFLIIDKENTNNIKKRINEVLSDFEQDVLKLYLKGESYQLIAGHLNKEIKSIDNAIQRIKRKLEKHLENKLN